MYSYIGTSGWQYGDWRDFYPKTLESWAFLPFYVHNFNSAEINVSFYRMLKKTTYEGWARAAEINPYFKFAVKLHNHFTRIKKLVLDADDIAMFRKFLENIQGLGKTLGPILVQLPPSAHCNIGELESFLGIFADLANEINPSMRIAIEFRHSSWLTMLTYDVLKKYNTAFVISDAPQWPTEFVKTADFVYMRLHGKPRMFYTLYTDEEMGKCGENIKKLNSETCYIYFNNTMRGHAAENAIDMKKIV